MEFLDLLNNYQLLR